MPLLEIKKISKHFDGLTAVGDFSLDVQDSEILGVIGPNGAGKTTFFNLICGFLPLSSGEVLFQGKLISGLHPHEIASYGIARTFQQSILFMDSTVFDNVFTGFHMSYSTGLLSQFLHTPSVHKEEKEIRNKTVELLDSMGLGPLSNELARNLPHGHQRILGICIALASKPALLLLDEPVTGMNPSETQLTIDLIRRLRDSGITIVLVEHDMKAVMSVCDRITVLNYGRKIAEGLPSEIMENKEVIEAYLGRGGV